MTADWIKSAGIGGDGESSPSALGGVYDERRNQVLLTLMAVGVPILGGFAVLHLLADHRLLAASNGAGAGGLFAGFFLLRARRGERWVLRVLTALVGVVTFIAFVDGGDSGGLLHWMHLFPLASFLLLLGRREAVFWTAGSVVLLVVALYWAPGRLPGFQAHQDELRSRFLLVYVAISWISYTFEVLRHRVESDLVAKHQEVEGERRRLGRATRLLEESNLALGRANESLRFEMKERAELELQLRRAERMEAIGGLASGLAHDLNNVLTAIVSYPDLVLAELPPDSPLRDILRTIQSSGSRASVMVQDLLTLAREPRAELERLDLNQVVEDYLRSPEYIVVASEHPHVRLRTALAEEALPVDGSVVQLAKVLMNLSLNAHESMTEAGDILVTTRPESLPKNESGHGDLPPGDYCVLRIEDEGGGIEEDDLAKIFEPFFTRKKLGRSGSGLGMSVVWSAVQEHGGVIQVRSAASGGTQFEVFLPRAREVTLPAPVPRPVNGSGERVLVVDDAPELCRLGSRMLRRLGYRALTAESGERALELLTHERVDLVLLDMIMEEGMDGLDTYRRMLDLRPGLPAIIVSGFAETDRVRETLLLGAGSFVAKPYTMATLGEAVRLELDRRADR